MGIRDLPQVWDFLAFAVLGVLPIWYATIVSRRNKMNEARSSIDVQLKQRLDLIPNILRIAQRFMEHEGKLLNQITQLRTQVTQSRPGMAGEGKQRAMEDLLSSKMGQLMVQVENYPQLKSEPLQLNLNATTRL
jgi:LemA protein